MKTKNEERLMTISDVAEHLQVPIATLCSWRSRGDGPRGFRIGRHVRYRRADLDAWIDSLQDRER
ncbi:helix-turn-helix transcriptional regulator [Jatrophihabitans sp. DSM 45814]